MANRTAPYPAYNYIVNLNGPRDPAKLLGGFSDVSGLSTEVHISEYRDGNEVESAVRKVPGSYKVNDCTLKRGVVDSSDLWAWMVETRTTGIEAQRDVIITLRDEAGNPVQSWKLRNAVPMKYTGPTLAGKGGGEVAMEELVLSAEGFEIAPAS
ncbi:MAG TPA: phage tail protein [Acidobacteriaceae bacterium]|jgi:phage tail-like protein|nr:phage tail protein [Acidobacteriaceae bacterium]